MRLLVGLAGGWIREGLAALPAREGLLACVDADVPLEVPRVCELLPTVLQGAGIGCEGGAGWRMGLGRAGGATCWPHLAFVDDGAIGLGLGTVAIGAWAQAPGLCAQLLARVRAGRLLTLLGGVPLVQLRPFFLDPRRHGVLLSLFSFPGWLHLHF